MFFAAVLGGYFGGLFLHPVGEIGFEPGSAFGADAEVSAGFTVDPVGEVDPVFDFVGAFSVPGEILAEVAVGFGAVVSEAFEDIEADFFIAAEVFDGGHPFVEAGERVDGSPAGLDAPGLVIDAGENDVDIAAVEGCVGGELAGGFGPLLDCAGDLPVGALDTVTEADGFDFAVGVAGPGVHGHGVGVVEEQRVGLGELFDVAAEIQERGDGALGVHDASGAEGVTDALVDAVFEGDVDIRGEGFETALADHAEDVVGIGDGLAAVGGGVDDGGELVCVDIALAQLGDHLEIVRIEIGEGEGGVAEFGHGEDVTHQATGESDGACADHCDFDCHLGSVDLSEWSARFEGNAWASAFNSCG